MSYTSVLDNIMCLINNESYSDVGNWDRSVVQDILKDIAQTQQVDLNAKKRFKGGHIVLSRSLCVY